MKKLIILFFGLFIGLNAFEPINAQNLYDLNFVVTKNDNVIGGDYWVKIQIREAVGSIDWKLGNSNIRFNYDNTKLEFIPGEAGNFEPHNFNGFDPGAGSFYMNMTSTGSGFGFMSFNIVLLIDGFGYDVTSTWADMVTAKFRLLSVTGNALCEFKPLTYDGIAGNCNAKIDDNIIDLFGGTGVDEIVWDGTQWTGGNGIGESPNNTDDAKRCTIMGPGGVIATDADVDNLIIMPGAQLQINEGVGLTAYGFTNHNADGGIHIKASPTGMGSFIDNSGYTGTGTTIVEQYLTENHWHIVSPPVIGATINDYFDIYLVEFDESTGDWTFLVEPLNIPMNMGQGYEAWSSSSSTGNSTVVFNGPTYTGDLPKQLEYTSTSPEAGWNLVGNPYPSSLDWNNTADWSRINVDATMYLYDHAAGNYKTWNPVSQLGTNGKADGYIAPTQGFWVKTYSEFAGLNIPQSQRLHSSTPFLKETVIENNILRIFVEGNEMTNESIIAFDQSATGEFDHELDGYFLEGLSEDAIDFYTELEDTRYAVNFLPSWGEYESVDLGFFSPAEGLFAITTEGIESFPSDLPIYLEDKQLNEWYNLRETDVYNFNSSPIQNNERFVIHFSSPMGLGDISLGNIQVYSNEKSIYVKIPFDFNGDVLVYDMMGKELVHKNATEGTNVIDAPFNKGHYLVRVQDTYKSSTHKVYIH